MSASLARTVFRPAPTARVAQAGSASGSACPLRSSLFPSSSGARQSISARTANAVAHVTVAAALVASAVSFASHPDTLVFEHPPRSAIGWTPATHLAVREREKNAAPTSRPPPTFSSSAASSSAASPFSATASSLRPTFQAAASAPEVAHELRLAGVIGRSLAGH
ncbi:hypothetical protein JCM10207_007215 [Rhodosporidiobolus poonsookiae]